MELANHIERHQQVTVLQEELPVRYAKLQMQYEALQQEMLDDKTRASYWEAQFNKFKSWEDILKEKIESLEAKLRKREQQLFGKKSEQHTGHQDQLNQSQLASKRNVVSRLVVKGMGKEIIVICQRLWISEIIAVIYTCL